MVPDSVLHYRIEKKLGEGGMGEVFLATDTRLDRKVALKFLPPHFTKDPEFKARFEHEARAAAALNHPNIVTVHELNEHEGRLFIAMEYVEGDSLEQLIAGGDLTLGRTLEITRQMCDGLGEAHQAGIIHRDIKPSNVLIDKKGRARILDFGLAKSCKATTETKTGTTLGTLQYESPEQCVGRPADARSDLFSLGSVLYEMITGRPPFTGDVEEAIRYSILHETPEPLARFKSDVPPELQRIVGKLLEKDSARRYQTAGDLAADLVRQRDTAEKRGRGGRRRGLILSTSAAAIALFALLVLKPWKIVLQPGQEVVASENRLAVLYFDNLVDPEDSQRLGEIVTNLLITDLSESQHISVVSSQRLYDILKQLGHEGERRIDREVATRVARASGARWMLLGSILNTDPDIVIASQIVETATGDSYASQRVEGQAGERIFPVVDRLTRAVKEDLALPTPADAEPDPRVAEMTTNSPEAYRLYLEGQELFYRHFWGDAETVFLEALRVDSTMAMAHFYLASMDYWRNDPEARMHIARAQKYADAASRKGRLYIASLDARLRGDVPRSIELLKEIIEEDPEDKSAYVSLGVLLRIETGRLQEAIGCFEKAVELDPFHREAHNQLAYCYNQLGRFDRAMWAVNKYVEIAPEEANAYDSRGEILAVNGKLDEAIESYEQAIRLKADFSRSPLASLYMYRGDLVRADSLVRSIAADPDKYTRASGRLALTWIPRYQGKFSEALRLLEVGLAADHMELGECSEMAEKLWTRVLINDLLGKRERIVPDLREAIALVEENEARDLYSGLYRGYLAAELTRNGNRSGADSLLNAIAASITDTGLPDSAHYWLASAFTHFNLKQFDTAAALWEKILARDPHHFAGLMYLGISYAETGRLGNAVSTLEKASLIFDLSRGGTPDMGVLCHYRLGRAYEASGWFDKAGTQYRTFLELWKDADPGIAEVEDAEVRLARLREQR